MFRFAYPFFLWGLCLLPVFVALFSLRMRWKRRAIERFGDPVLVDRLVPDRSIGRVRLKFIMMCFAFVLLVVGLSDPQIGSRYEEVKRQGIDLILALDVSNSMLAEDIKPSRLERSKQAILRLLDKLGDDRIGIVVFAGDAFLQLPFTNDYAAARMFLSGVSNESIQAQGTAIGTAIDLGVKALPKGGVRSKAIVVISDGENHEDDAIEAAKNAREKNVLVYTLGIGSEQGAPVPVIEESGGKGYRRDENGNPVISAMNPAMLSDVARAGGGKFVQASNSDVGLEKLVEEISSLQKTEMGNKAFTDYEDRFQYFLGFALLILIIELLTSERKNKRLLRLNPLNRKEEQV